MTFPLDEDDYLDLEDQFERLMSDDEKEEEIDRIRRRADLDEAVASWHY